MIFSANCLIQLSTPHATKICEESEEECPKPSFTLYRQPGLKTCDLQTEDCPEGTYGYECLSKCGHCEDSAICDKGNGDCPGYTCEVGWMGKDCHQKCPGGTYGENCSERCGHCYGEDGCDHVTGECGKCDGGWQGRKCNTTCPHQRFGYNCSGTCHCYMKFTCDPVTGSCGQHGCTVGWMGDQCSIYSPCNQGYYGKHCQECGACLMKCDPSSKDCDPDCDRVTGQCSHGCRYNFVGPRCDVCVGRKYGLRCEHECGHCFRGYVCHMRTGICGRTGCDPGYLGSKCDLECKDGLYGMACTQKCSGHCLHNRICRFTDGSCTWGCSRGWTDLTCGIPDCKVKTADNAGLCTNVTECYAGMWGERCENSCGRCAEWEGCDNTTGICQLGCMGHFLPPLCTECREGWFGELCDSVCGHCRYSQLCHSITGSCTHGCATRFTGAHCNTRKKTMVVKKK